MCPGAYPTRLRIFGMSHTQGLWRFCTCKTFGVSLHPGLLEHLCTKSFWDISASGVSPSTSTCKSFGVSLHLEPQTQNFWGITAPLEHFCIQNFWGSGPLGHLSRKSLGVSHTQQCWSISHPELLGCLCTQSLWTPHTQDFRGVSHPGLWSIGSRAELQAEHTGGVPEPRSREDPDPCGAGGPSHTGTTL